jgi:hypothetical protein
MRATKCLVVLGAVLFILAPSPARAEGFVNPWVGLHFGDAPADGDIGFGVAAGSNRGGIIGLEADFGYFPSFFEKDAGKNTVMTLMGNVMVEIVVSPSGKVVPYLAGGIGLIRTSLDVAEFRQNDFGYNLGAGAMGYFSNRVGVRGDVRYMRAVGDNASVTLDSGRFDFWRATFGVVIR